MNQEKPKLYSVAEAAKKLGISPRMLGYYRRTGRIQGIELGNATLYTEEQLTNANLTRLKPGPKTSEGNDEKPGMAENSLLCTA